MEEVDLQGRYSGQSIVILLTKSMKKAPGNIINLFMENGKPVVCNLIITVA